jgi:hypothetical protein
MDRGTSMSRATLLARLDTVALAALLALSAAGMIMAFALAG